MTRYLRSIWKPEVYHGFGKKPVFFEGWFFKLVDASGGNTLAVIPGNFVADDPAQSHSFIQILDGITHESYYFRYSAESFKADESVFDITVGASRFTQSSLDLNVRRPQLTIKGTLSFEDTKPWPVTFFAPGCMGWYAFMPFMECYHGVPSMDHHISGTLERNGKSIDYTGGRGYIEKDWGRSFPSSYVWAQSNHFDREGIAFTGSIAKIPWLGSWFRGFIVGFLFDGKLHRFTTYTGARLRNLDVTETHVRYEVEDGSHRLYVEIERNQTGSLHAPYNRQMLERVSESLDSVLRVSFFRRSRKGDVLLYEGTGRHAGLDINGSMSELLGV